MQGALHLAVGTFAAVAAVHVHGAQHGGHVAILVLLAAFALDDISAHQAYFVAGEQAEVLLGGNLHKVFLLHVDLPGHDHLVAAHFRVLGMVLDLQLVTLVFGPVGQDHLQGANNRHGAGHLVAQIVADAAFQQGHIHGAVRLGKADAVDEVADGLGGEATAAHGAQGGHAGIIPAGDETALHQRAQVALAHHGAGQVQTAELDLTGTARQHGSGLFHHPVVQGAVILILQRAQAVGDAFQRVTDGMGEVVHGIDAPFLARAVMLLVQDAVHGGVAHVDVGGGHIDLHAQDHAAFGMLASLHFLEQAQVFLHGTVTIGAVLARLGEGAAVFAHLLLTELVHISQIALDPVHGDIVALLIVLAGKEQAALPVEAQPADVIHDAVHILGFFLGGVGIVKAQVGHAAVALSGQKVRHQRLAVTNVQVAVGFRGKTGVHALAAPAP